VIWVIREEDLLVLQTAILDAAVAKTVPGQSYLKLDDFLTLLNQRFDRETLAEMLKELVGEGILQQGAAGQQYCVSQAYLASIAGN